MARYGKAIQSFKASFFSLTFFSSVCCLVFLFCYVLVFLFFFFQKEAMTGSPKLERLFLLYNCKCSLYLSEEIIFQGEERGSKRRKQDISKTLFSRKAEYITLHLWGPIQGAIIACITIVPKASSDMKELFYEGLHGYKGSCIYSGNWETKSRYSGIYF